MIIETSTNDGIFILTVWVGEHEHLSSTLSFNIKHTTLDYRNLDYLVVFAFSCGDWNCVVLNNGSIIASSGSAGFVTFNDAAIAAKDAFTPDPRCEHRNIGNKSSFFTVRDAWMGDREVMLHWGGGCYVALEVLVDHQVPRVLTTWVACVGTDIPRAPGAIQVYLGQGTFAVVSAVFEGSVACVEDGMPVSRHLITGGISSICDANTSSSVNFSDIEAENFYGELFIRDSESVDTPLFTLALFKIPWRLQFSSPARHISDSNISSIPNMVQTRPMCQLTGVIATTGFISLCSFSIILLFHIYFVLSSVSTSCWNV